MRSHPVITRWFVEEGVIVKLAAGGPDDENYVTEYKLIENTTYFQLLRPIINLAITKVEVDDDDNQQHRKLEQYEGEVTVEFGVSEEELELRLYLYNNKGQPVIDPVIIGTLPDGLTPMSGFKVTKVVSFGPFPDPNLGIGG